MMASGLDHSRAAEETLDKFDKPDGEYWYDVELNDRTELELRIAAVHAQLATAGAVAALTRSFQRVFEKDPAKARDIAQQRAQLVALGIDGEDGGE